MRTKLLRKFRKRFQIVNHKGYYTLLDVPALKISCRVPIEGIEERGPVRDYNYLIKHALCELLPYSYFKLERKRAFRRLARYYSKQAA